jgi:sentrin-specific protease 1
LILISLHFFFQWLQDEAVAKNKRFVSDDWLEIRKKNIPIQENGFDCGMFLIMYVDTLIRNNDVDNSSFTAEQLSEFRLKLAKAILQGSLFT